MSLIRCLKHDHTYDSDFLSECPFCENEGEDDGPQTIFRARYSRQAIASREAVNYANDCEPFQRPRGNGEANHPRIGTDEGR